MIENFLGFKHKLVQKCFSLELIRKLSSDFTVSEHFPNIDKLRARYLYLKMAENSFKNFICDELIEECNIDKSSFYLQGFERRYIVTVDIEVLKKHGLIMPDSNQMSITSRLLGYLEPFPFDSKNMPPFKSHLSSCVTIKSIRDSIERQYLAWKFGVDLQQSKGFSNKQIQESIPFLHLSCDTFLSRMNVLLSHPLLAQHQKHDKFLQLLVYPSVYIMNLGSISFLQSLEELRDAINMIHSKIKLRSRSQQITINSIRFHTSNYFAIDNEHLNIIKRHPKYPLVTEQQLGSTLKFLERSGFSRAEILESITIILYPRRAIFNALKKIAEEAKDLEEFGFINGCVPEQTNFFKPGTKLKQKTLQLCIYYIEKQFNFSWDGVLNLDIKKYNEEKEP